MTNHTNDHQKNDHQEKQKLWELVEGFRVCMATTHDGLKMSSRPMAPTVFADEEEIRFLSDVKAHKVDELVKDPSISLVFVDSASNTYVSVYGETRIVNDKDAVEQLWSPYASAWFEADDPKKSDAAVLVVKPVRAEYWDGTSSTLKVAWETLKANHTDQKPDVGTSEKVTFN